MRRIFMLLIILSLILVCGCSNDDINSDNKSIVSLPTNHTELTANGYRNPALAVSSNSSSNSSILSSTTQTDEPKTYVASKNSKTFHLITCSSAKRIKEENIIIFIDYEEASLNGYSPCSFCLLKE